MEECSIVIIYRRHTIGLLQ